ncbi:alpha/beta hydrolase [Actinoplanes sp. NPDC023714]|uniref:alpha/beta hydrolase n=1 Tax=Actinoplanes sp. NPDC023714 TaxID=3154322 RepID=UPI0033DAB74E
MDATIVLVHSPSVGPSTWAPVADRLDAPVLVPSLLGVADEGPPFWRPVAQAVQDVLHPVRREHPIVIVAHSNAGLFVPAIVDASPRRVAGCLFVDAALPATAGPTPVAPPELLDFLRPKLRPDGRLPQWTQWWDEADVAPMFPDPATRALVTAEQPRLPLSYYEEHVPVPAGWDDRPCGYLLFAPAYEPMAKEAAHRGWRVDHLPGEHLHQLVDPDAVTAHIRTMTAGWSG